MSAKEGVVQQRRLAAAEGRGESAEGEREAVGGVTELVMHAAAAASSRVMQ